MQPFFTGFLKHSKTYEIKFSGLTPGNHLFEWSLEPTFFNSYGNEEILDSKLHVAVSLEKKERFMKLYFHIIGAIKTLCDRCGDEVWIDIEANEELLVRFSTETDMTDDEVIFLDSSEYKIDIGHYFYEFAYLAIPQKRTHTSGECSTEYEDFFEEPLDENKAIVNNNQIDPRWEALKKLK